MPDTCQHIQLNGALSVSLCTHASWLSSSFFDETSLHTSLTFSTHMLTSAWCYTVTEIDAPERSLLYFPKDISVRHILFLGNYDYLRRDLLLTFGHFFLPTFVHYTALQTANSSPWFCNQGTTSFSGISVGSALFDKKAFSSWLLVGHQRVQQYSPYSILSHSQLPYVEVVSPTLLAWRLDIFLL